MHWGLCPPVKHSWLENPFWNQVFDLENIGKNEWFSSQVGSKVFGGNTVKWFQQNIYIYMYNICMCMWLYMYIKYMYIYNWINCVNFPQQSRFAAGLSELS